ncbi:MAG: chemotaxis protein CheB [Bacteroidota bacterium]
MVSPEKKEQQNLSDNLYVVGIGASAGGLEAINELFDNLPENTDFAFVIVQHLSPDYKSLMGELLSKHTSMQVFEAENGMAVKPNSVYLLPSKKLMTLKGGSLCLEEKIKSNVPNNAIDVFFESLASDKADKAVAIILSGTGTDGTKGANLVKENGGTVVVQDPLTAEFDGMPNSAIATGDVDLILPPEIIADELIEYLKESPLTKTFNTLNRQEEAILADVMDLIFQVTSHDFSHYKRPTINRRLTKRMAERGYNNLLDYYNFLKKNPEEVKTLSKEFLINVTKFFRDEDAYAVIQKEVIPNLIEDPKRTEPIKIWSVGCSSGEEPYSLAMLFHEYIQSSKRFDTEVKIFATDIHQESLDFASKGLYSAESLKDMAEDRRKRFFIKEGDSYRVSPTLRKMVVFAKQNILKDPPFSKIDLLSCRNMLIYMNPLLQKNVLKKFHFAINENGYLFLGPSENIGALKDSVREIDKKWKIYQCISKPRPGDHDTFLNPAERSTNYLDFSSKSKSKNALTNIADIFKETLFEEHNYAGIYIDKEFDVKQAIGNFKNFINFPEGNFNFNLLKLVPTDLSIALSTAIRKAVHDNTKVVLKKIRVTDNKKERIINIIVKPYLVQQTYTQPFIFIILNEEAIEQRKPFVSKQSEGTEGLLGQRLEEVEEELRNTKENLQAVIEEVESANEELQSSNEEIISSNEELQSTNEELQSLNEELHTVNAEHQLKIKELVELNDDMNNYFRNTEVGQILVDKKMIIKKFTPVATRQVNLIESDIGRSITDISTNFVNLDFINDIKKVLNSGQSLEKEIRIENGTVFIMRIAPYLRLDKIVDGVVISFINVTESKRLNSLIEAIFNASTSAITALKPLTNKKGEIIDFEFITSNDASKDILGVKAAELIGKKWVTDFPSLLAPHFHSLLLAKEGGRTINFDCFNEANNLWLEVSAVKMYEGIVTTFTNTTQAKESYQKLQKASDELNQINVQLEQSNFDLLQFASVASHDLKEPLRKIQTFGNLLHENIKDKIEGKDSNYLEKIIRSANRMQVLIQDILTLSKLSNSDIPYTSVNINDIITNIIDDLDVSIKERNVQVRTENLPVIHAIPGQIHQLFQNLLSNSIKFNKSDTPLITITNKPVSEKDSEELAIKPKEYICIELKDNGIGFDEQYKEKIFGIFQRLTGTEYEGTGIGLAICKKIVDNHNGYIKAESTPGKGSSFFIFLPNLHEESIKEEKTPGQPIRG